MELFLSLDDAIRNAKERDYVIAELGEGGVFIKTPIFTMQANAETSRHNGPRYGYFEYNLPKIPISYFKEIEGFFKKVNEYWRTEAYCEIRYENGNYAICIPPQYCTPTSVRYESPDDSPESYCVASIHSHNRMPAFFSSIDDADEKGKKLYGVFGNLSERTQFIMRACAGGKWFTYVDPKGIVSPDAERCPYNSNDLTLEWDIIRRVRL